MDQIPVVIIEDNRLLRESIKAIIERERDFKLVAACENIDKLSQGLSDAMPGVVLLQLDQCNQNAFQLVRAVELVLPNFKIIIMSLIPDQGNILRLISNGVAGFILKDAAAEELLLTIRIVNKGGNVLPTGLTEILFSQINIHINIKHEIMMFAESGNLSLREKQVKILVSEGLSNKEIALKLNLSCYTIKHHVHNILKKLAVRTRVQIARIAAY
ncbi:MAG: LuxR C-terminal-related transcriptional regulator [Bacillota bacterium]